MTSLSSQPKITQWVTCGLATPTVESAMVACFVVWGAIGMCIT